MQKRSLFFILVLVASLCLSACGVSRTPTPEEQIEQTKNAFDALSDQADERNEKREKLIEKNKVDLKEELVLTGPEVNMAVKAYSVIPWTTLGTDVVQMYFIFDYTNQSAEDKQFSDQVQITGYQDGIELDAAPYWDDTALSAIRPNTKIERKEAVVLRNEKSDVILKLTDLKTDESVEYTIKIK